MPENQELSAIGRLAYEKATHAPVFERYRGGGFVPVGDDPEPGMPWRIDPDTGAEIHALGGLKGKFSTDLKVSSYYPATVFVFGDRPDGEPASHDELEQFLRDHDRWSDALNPIVVPDSDGLRPGFQYRPPGRQPYSIKKLRGSIRDQFGLDDHEILGNDRGFQAFLG